MSFSTKFTRVKPLPQRLDNSPRNDAQKHLKYERLKRELPPKLTAREYTAAIVRIARECGV